MCNGIFTEVIKKRGNVSRVRKIKGDDLFVVTDGSGNYAHGETVKEAKKDLLFKKASKNKDQYKSLTLESEMSFDEAVICYRVITGACSFGVNDFLKNRLTKRKKKYKISEMIELTSGEYGIKEFANFFNN